MIQWSLQVLCILKYVDQFFPARYICPALHYINSLLWSLFRMRNTTADFSPMYPLISVEMTLSFVYLSLNEVGAHKMLVRDKYLSIKFEVVVGVL
jgi:hypothetical protein